jgi:hypothetical protein
MGKLCTNKNRSYKHNEQINKQNIDKSECFGVKFVKIYPEMTSQSFFENMFFFTFPNTFDSLAIKNTCLRLIKICL